MSLCTNLPIIRYVNDPMWMVELSNGVTVYQDDDDGNSWAQLKQYVEDNGLYLKNMHIRFRDHIEQIGSDSEAYYFVNSILASTFGYQQSFFVTGVVAGDVIHCKEWIIPELMVYSGGDRNINDSYNRELVISGKGTN